MASDLPDRRSGAFHSMTDDARMTNLLSYIGKSGNSAVESPTPDSGRTAAQVGHRLEPALWSVMAAHAVELRKSEVIDDAALSAIGRSLQRAVEQEAEAGQPARYLIDALEERVESQLPPSVAGVATLGLSR